MGLTLNGSTITFLMINIMKTKENAFPRYSGSYSESITKIQNVHENSIFAIPERLDVFWFNLFFLLNINLIVREALST